MHHHAQVEIVLADRVDVVLYVAQGPGLLLRIILVDVVNDFLFHTLGRGGRYTGPGRQANQACK